MTEQSPETTLHCYRHPQRETLLRCNRCERPICSECSVLTPTGYRCKECVHGQQKTYDTTQWWDFPVAMIIAALVSFGGSLLSAGLGFLTVFIAPLAGLLISEVVRRALKRRRSLRLFRFTAGAALFGSLPILLINALGFILNLAGGTSLMSGNIIGIVLQILYTVLVTSTTYYRLSGIQIQR